MLRGAIAGAVLLMPARLALVANSVTLVPINKERRK